MSAASKPLATAETLRALGDEPREVMHGVLVRRADPSAAHGDAQLGLGSTIRGSFHRSTGGPGVLDRPHWIGAIRSSSNGSFFGDE